PERAGDPGHAGRASLPLHRLSRHGRRGAGARGIGAGRGAGRRREGAVSTPRPTGALRTPEGGYIGAPIPRREDARLLTGRGTFVDDLEMPGVSHAAMVRSPHAHARIVRIDTEASRALPGVLAVVTAADMADIQKPGPVRIPSPVPGTVLRHGAHYTLPPRKVSHV